MSKQIELNLLRTFRQIADKLPLIYIYIQSRENYYKAITDSYENFTNFFNLITHSYKQLKFNKIILLIGTEQYTITNACPICVEFQSENQLHYLVHFIISHSRNTKLDIIHYTVDKILQINVKSVEQQKSNEYIRYANFMNRDQFEIYQFIYLYQLANCSVILEKSKPQDSDIKIQNLMQKKKFYHGPSKNYRQIMSVKEFKELEQNDKEFVIQNEMQCLLKSTPQFKDTVIQQFMILYNRKCLEEKPKRLGQFLKQFLDLRGDMLICFQNHLFTLMSYGLIDQGTFYELSLQICDQK